VGGRERKVKRGERKKESLRGVRYGEGRRLEKNREEEKG
jgi:hypothetical protein